MANRAAARWGASMLGERGQNARVVVCVSVDVVVAVADYGAAVKEMTNDARDNHVADVVQASKLSSPTRCNCGQSRRRCDRSA